MATPSTQDAAQPPSDASNAPNAPPAAPSQRNTNKRTRLDALADLPAFILSAFLLYWSLPIAALFGRVRFWQLKGKRDDALGW